ncbi:nucleotidyl transferase AbiEii/AbiGii toxin family protein [Flaviaesturariibacter amylovorans]|uniref:Nucleotidyl transferase AbiEii/AbiGii toxin family protein n=1 Tax=Flaviaesturariibacter amylovorans TaxID=1084520 RepID=A0ABP8H5T1_9BACT
MIKEWINEYNPKGKDEAEAALREIMQEVALAGLQRSGFFEVAAFYGGTALRIFHGLDRFSEDLDFSLLQRDEAFSLEPYLAGIVTEFEALGMQVSVREKKKKVATGVDSAFLKSETVWKELTLDGAIPQLGLTVPPALKIKLEVDREPPLGFSTEELLLIRPFSFYVKCFTLPDLFAGKMHALLFRKWGTRVKGRDWYDLEWYVKRAVPLHLEHFRLRAADSGDWTEDTISEGQFRDLLTERIESVSFASIREDVIRFIPDATRLEIWSPQYFKDLAKRLKIQ